MVMINKKPANRLSKSTATINTKKVVVKQDMIDFIKTQGMTKALERAGKIKASGKGGEREFLEGVRRMYGQRRLDAATKGAGPKMPTMTAPAGANKKPANRLSKSAATIQTKVGSKPAPKKSSGMSTGAKITGGAIAAAALIASRGKATGLASKFSPAVAKALGAKTGANTAANVMARKFASEGVKVGPKGSFGPSTAAAAKAGKNVGTKSEFAQKAMQDKARAYLASRAAAKAAPTKAAASKPVAPKPKLKKTAPKKRAMAAGGIGSVTLKGDTAKTKKK
jgi:hypothetical protein